MTRLKKAQTATEYLIILAVVIIIALVAVSVLGGFPTLFTSQSGEMLSEAYWESAKISIRQHRIAGSEGTFYFMNKMRFPIRIINISLDENKLEEAEGKVIPSGSTLVVTDNDFVDGRGNPYCQDRGEDKYAFSVQINYEYSDTGEGPFVFTGLKKVIGTCQ